MATEHSTTTITGGHANAVASGAAGFISGANQAKLDGIAAGAADKQNVVMHWGAVAAAGNSTTRYFLRTGAALGATGPGQGEYVCPIAGTVTVTLTWAVNTPLVTDTVALTVMNNGVATALTATITASTASGQASASLLLAVGDRLSVRTVQSASEVQAAWNGMVSISFRG